VDIMQNESLVRLVVFFGVFAAVALWEIVVPFRDLSTRKPLRWVRNLGLLGVDTILVRLVLPLGAIGASLLAAERGWGLFNVIDAPRLVTVIASVVILDFAIYVQHVVFHAIPALWRLHMVHHADLDFDVTTGARFHPIEIVLSMVIKLAAVVVLGAPPVAVVIFEVILNATSMFNHGNLHLPAGVDRVLRLFVVTPDMHRVHHSVIPAETNSNFGFSLPWWDRLFGTYRAQPKDGHDGMAIGIEQFRTKRDLWLDRMLIQPLAGPASTYPINREESGGE